MPGLSSAIPLLAVTGSGGIAIPPPDEREIIETLGLTYRLVDIRQRVASISETLGLEPAATTLSGIILIERLGLTQSVAPNQVVGTAVEESLGLIEQLLPALPVVVAETLALSMVETIQQATTVIEELGLQPALAPEAIFNLSVAERIRLGDSLANFFGAGIIESLALAPLLSTVKLVDQQISETLGLTEEHVANLVVRVEVTEELGIEDVDLLNAIYTGTISEGLGLSLAYISPGGGFTAWAMNTRTGAVTEYDNYAFNSFARLGDKYLGATSDGLYELAGDDDDGSNIVARIKSGFAQWAGARFTLLKGIYLGVRGEGNFVLKVITGDDKTYVYAVAANSMKTTKVRTGKGIRARYLRFELISSGTNDFDLESIEFVPLVADRRV